MIVIVEYGIGNLLSVRRAFRKINVEAVVSCRPEDVEAADRLVIPGVGSLAHGMDRLRQYGLIPVLNRKVLDEKTPVLGICLGMQMFSEWSEEGGARGLGWIEAETRRFNFDEAEKQFHVPHMGWNELAPRRPTPLFEGLAKDACFYFAHSYCVDCRNEADVLATTRHGYDFVSAVQRQNIFGTQFHPEKSHENGLKVVRNFVEWPGHA